MDDETLATPTILCPAPDAASFTVDGVTYTATDGLSTARLKVFQRLEIEFGTDAGLVAHIQGLDAAWAALNEAKLATGIHALGLIRDNLNLVGKNRLKAPEICALFFCAPGEDAGTYDYTAMCAKVAAWGAVHGGFFTVAAPRLARSLWGSYGDSLAPESLPTSRPEPAPTA
jgi:hypothetical protein